MNSLLRHRMDWCLIKQNSIKERGSVDLRIPAPHPYEHISAMSSQGVGTTCNFVTVNSGLSY